MRFLFHAIYGASGVVYLKARLEGQRDAAVFETYADFDNEMYNVPDSTNQMLEQYAAMLNYAFKCAGILDVEFLGNYKDDDGDD